MDISLSFIRCIERLIEVSSVNEYLTIERIMELAIQSGRYDVTIIYHWFGIWKSR